MENNNSQIESLVFEGKPEWIAYCIPLGIAVILALTLYAIPISVIIAVYVVISVIQYNFKVTNHRITVHKGILSKKTFEIDINDIRSINVTQSLFQRLFGVGNLEFTTAAGPYKEAMLINIREPESLKEKIRNFKSK